MMPGMARWEDFAGQAPEFAARVRAVLDRHKHKTMATLRRDGAPRISGAEVHFVGPDVFTGSMPRALKGLDLRRDPRVAFHSASEDADEQDPGSWVGDAKFAGRAVLVSDPAEIAAFWADYTGTVPPEPDSSDLFRIDVDEVVLTWIDPPETMVIESWHSGAGHRRRTRT
jgi:hypothetical protein